MTQITVRQRGFSLVTIIFVIALVGFFGILASKCIPAFNEYLSIKHAVKSIESSGETSLSEARKSFDKFSEVDRIESIKGADVIFLPFGKGLVANYTYEARVHLVGNATLLLEFSSK